MKASHVAVTSHLTQLPGHVNTAVSNRSPRDEKFQIDGLGINSHSEWKCVRCCVVDLVAQLSCVTTGANE